MYDVYPQYVPGNEERCWRRADETMVVVEKQPEYDGLFDEFYDTKVFIVQGFDVF